MPAAEKATTVNGHTIAAAMATISGMHMAEVPVPVSFTTPNSNPKIAQVFDTQDAVYKLENGKWNYAGPVDLTSDLAGFLNSSSSNVGWADDRFARFRGNMERERCERSV